MSDTAKGAIGLVVIVAFIIGSLNGDDSDTSSDFSSSSSVGLEDTSFNESYGDPAGALSLSAADVVAFTYSSEDIQEFCDQAAILGYDLAYEGFEIGAGELGGVEDGIGFPSTQEVFDEMYSYC